MGGFQGRGVQGCENPLLNREGRGFKKEVPRGGTGTRPGWWAQTCIVPQGTGFKSVVAGVSLLPKIQPMPESRTGLTRQHADKTLSCAHLHSNSNVNVSVLAGLPAAPTRNCSPCRDSPQGSHFPDKSQCVPQGLDANPLRDSSWGQNLPA